MDTAYLHRVHIKSATLFTTVTFAFFGSFFMSFVPLEARMNRSTLCYSTVSLVPPISTMGPIKREIHLTVTAAVSCDGRINAINHCLSWSKFVNTHLSHFRQ